MEKLCAEQFDRISDQANLHPVPAYTSATYGMSTNLMLYPLRDEETCIGLVGLMSQENVTLILPDLWERLLRLIANTISRLAEHVRSERQLAHLSTYLTVSSMLAQSLGLHELLEASLYCSMEAVSAEAASVLLLDDEKKTSVSIRSRGLQSRY